MNKIVDEGLEKYNYSKNEYLNPVIYTKELKKFGFYALDGTKVIGGANRYIDEYLWTFLD